MNQSWAHSRVGQAMRKFPRKRENGRGAGAAGLRGIHCGKRRQHQDPEPSHRGPDSRRRHRGARRPSVKLDPPLHLQLQRADFAMAARVTEALNNRFGAIAHADNAALVTVSLPQAYEKKITEFVAALELLTVETDSEAVIVVNERTGTIVMGKDVQIAPVAIMQNKTQLNE